MVRLAAVLPYTLLFLTMCSSLASLSFVTMVYTQNIFISQLCSCCLVVNILTLESSPVLWHCCLHCTFYCHAGDPLPEACNAASCDRCSGPLQPPLWLLGQGGPRAGPSHLLWRAYHCVWHSAEEPAWEISKWQ